MLTFGDFEIPGSHLLLYGKWNYQRQETQIFGTSGVTVLTGELTTRDLTFESWIYDDFEDESSLESFLISLEQQQGSVATLEEDNDALSRSWDNVEFAGFEMGRGPFPPGGSLPDSWFVIGKLHFLQLQP
jgi:hypothetical protein